MFFFPFFFEELLASNRNNAFSSVFRRQSKKRSLRLFGHHCYCQYALACADEHNANTNRRNGLAVYILMVYMKAFFPLSSFLTWTTTAASLVLVISTALALSASTSSADLSSSSSTTSSSTTPSTCDTTMTKFRSVRKVMERPSRHW